MVEVNSAAVVADIDACIAERDRLSVENAHLRRQLTESEARVARARGLADEQDLGASTGFVGYVRTDQLRAALNDAEAVASEGGES